MACQRSGGGSRTNADRQLGEGVTGLFRAGKADEWNMKNREISYGCGGGADREGIVKPSDEAERDRRTFG